MRGKGSRFIALGLLLMLAAVGLTGYNLLTQQMAGRSAAAAVGRLEEMLPATELNAPVSGPEAVIPDYVLDPTMEMPEAQIDGVDYIGMLEIPALGLALPVVSEWSYAKLKLAPCRYQGSAYTDDLIIAAHNYRSHFGSLKNLREGDGVWFTDTDGNVFRYEVVSLESIQGTDVDGMLSGEWDLTLFTCTLGGQNRLTVRCEAIG